MQAIQNRILSGAIAALFALLAFGVVPGAVDRADAAAFTYEVYPPDRLTATEGRAWANLSRDCTGTYGCYNFMKVERNTWWGLAYQGGSWVNNHGWNSVTVGLSGGCHSYRTVVDSYNDVAGTTGVGINIGPVGVSSNGTKIYRFKRTWTSGWRTHCR